MGWKRSVEVEGEGRKRRRRDGGKSIFWDERGEGQNTSATGSKSLGMK